MKLIHNITKQIVDIELVDEFLAAVEDAAHWVVHEAEEILGVDTSIADVGLPGTSDVLTTDQGAALETADLGALSTDQIPVLSTEQAVALEPAAVEAPAADAAPAAEQPAEAA